MSRFGCVALLLLGSFVSLALSQTISLPGLGSFTLEVADVPCFAPYNYASKFNDAKATANCTAAVSTLWKGYVKGFSTTTFFPAIKTTTSMATCETAADLVTTGAPRTAAKGMCTYVQTLATACACELAECATDFYNKDVRTVVAYNALPQCYLLPQKMCKSIQTGLNTACPKAIDTAPTAYDGLLWSKEGLRRNCDPTTCRASSAYFRVGVSSLVGAAVVTALFSTL